jgi:hypothetical protein
LELKLNFLYLDARPPCHSHKALKALTGKLEKTCPFPTSVQASAMAARVSVF